MKPDKYPNGYVEVSYLIGYAWVNSLGSIFVRKLKIPIGSPFTAERIIQGMIANGYYIPRNRPKDAQVFIPPSAIIEMRIYQ